MPALDNETIYCHLVDRADSDNLIIPGDITVSGTVTGATSAATSTVTDLTVENDLTIEDAGNIILDTTTGTKIGTAATQKIGFFNATPVAQQNVPTTTPSVQNVIDALVALGLVEQSDA